MLSLPDNAGLDCDEDREDSVGVFVNEHEFNETLQVGAMPDVLHLDSHKIILWLSVI